MRKFVISLGLMSLLAACANPLADVATIGEVELQEDTPQADALAAPVDTNDTRPLFQRLLGNGQAPEKAAAPVVDEAPEAADAAVDATVSDGSEAVAAQDDAIEAAVAQAAPEPVKKPKLFGFLKQKPASKSSGPIMADTKKLETSDEANVVQASLSAEPEANPIVAQEAERGAFKGLFSQRKAARLTGPDAEEVAPGTALPYGVIARVCKLKRSEMGREVERSSDGKGKFRLYDSAPGSTALRPYYITGFDDGCPRQITAALAMFGDVARHEFLRYGPATKDQPWSETDTQYEKIKRQVCKVGKGKPCGSNLTKLEKSTSFVTVYSTFVGSPAWRNILLHDGSVVAMN